MSCGSLFLSDHGFAGAMPLARGDPSLGVLHPRVAEQALSHWREIHACWGGDTEASQGKWKWFCSYLDLSSLVQRHLLDNALQLQLEITPKFN